MAHKEQNKILDATIESNVNQYKVDRLNAEISVFSSGDLNKYEFLKRIDLNYNPLGKTFSTGLDKTAQGYQEEGIIKLLKDIRDGLAGGITPRAPRAPRAPDLDRPDDNDNDDNDNDDNNMPDLETEEEAAKTNILNKFNNKINNFDEMVRNKLNNDVKKLDNYIKENNNEKINKEKELDTVKNEYNRLLLKLNQSNEEFNRTRNELFETKKKLDEAADDINEKTKYIDKLKEIKEKYDYQNNKVKELESELNKKNNDIKKLQKKLEEDKIYFDNYDENRTELEKKLKY